MIKLHLIAEYQPGSEGFVHTAGKIGTNLIFLSSYVTQMCWLCVSVNSNKHTESDIFNADLRRFHMWYWNPIHIWYAAVWLSLNIQIRIHATFMSVQLRIHHNLALLRPHKHLCWCFIQTITTTMQSYNTSNSFTFTLSVYFILDFLLH